MRRERIEEAFQSQVDHRPRCTARGKGGCALWLRLASRKECIGSSMTGIIDCITRPVRFRGAEVKEVRCLLASSPSSSHVMSCRPIIQRTSLDMLGGSISVVTVFTLPASHTQGNIARYSVERTDISRFSSSLHGRCCVTSVLCCCITTSGQRRFRECEPQEPVPPLEASAPPSYVR